MCIVSDRKYFVITYLSVVYQAEEITLTIGQAFDLAYRRFLDTSNKDLDTKKQFLMLQKKVYIANNQTHLLFNFIF